jgi:hypothetical protein
VPLAAGLSNAAGFFEAVERWLTAAINQSSVLATRFAGVRYLRKRGYQMLLAALALTIALGLISIHRLTP